MAIGHQAFLEIGRMPLSQTSINFNGGSGRQPYHGAGPAHKKLLHFQSAAIEACNTRSMSNQIRSWITDEICFITANKETLRLSCHTSRAPLEHCCGRRRSDVCSRAVVVPPKSRALPTHLIGAKSVEGGAEPPREVLDRVEQERQQSVLHLAVELFLDGLRERASVFVLVRRLDAIHLTTPRIGWDEGWMRKGTVGRTNMIRVRRA